MFNEDGSVAVVFNGEIYNYLELRQELEKAGHRFATHSDTEAIVHIYEEYGPEGLAKLNGMFALAVWDRGHEQLLLARDRAGKKPLYYCNLNGRLVFSSELASLLEYPGISREIDGIALDNYFCFGYVPSPRTIYRDVKQLQPGHYLLWRGGELHVAMYWRLHSQPSGARSKEDAAEELLGLVKDAVRIRLHSDVPFGALLSGGVDSSLVVALMSQLMDRPVDTFTVGFSDKEFDESGPAEELARHFGTHHHSLIAGSHSVADLLQKLTTHFGEPFADASAIPTFLVSEMARKHVTMALSGDGGDEVFGGYTSYRYHASAAVYRQMPALLRGAMRAGLRRVNGSAGALGRRIRRFVEHSELPVELAWRHSRGVFSDADLDQLYTPEFLREVVPAERGFRLRDSFHHFAAGARQEDVLNFVDYETYLPDDILVKVDRMSMANSLEMRAPLLDYRIAEFAAGLPADWKWTPWGGKRILKQAAAKVLPKSVLTRRKQGFEPPIGSWLRADLKPLLERVIHSPGRHPIRLDYCRQLFDRHAAGEGGLLERKLWLVFCYLLWHEQFGS
jgi:asparagine synthase (glutamine-hydrolysing)